MSGFFQSSNNSSGSSNQNTSPWGPQQGYLTSGFQNAQNIYNQQAGQPFYQGELYAQLNPQQLSALSGLNSYAAGGGANVANTQTNTGTAAVSGVSNAANDAQSLYSKTQQDPTQGIINSAGLYANNPYTQGMIAAAQRPIDQALNEQALPQLNMNATATGNANSSRAGVAQAILQRNAANQKADVASNILGNEYNQGLNTAEGLYGTNLNTGLGASYAENSAGNSGANLLDQGYNTTMNNLNVPLQTGTVQQQNQQGADQAGYTRWQGQMSQPWNTLNNYWSVVANRPWGSVQNGTTTGQVTSNPSGAQDLFGILSDPRLKIINDDPTLANDPELQAAANGGNAYKAGLNEQPGFWGNFLNQLLAGTQVQRPTTSPDALGVGFNPGAGIPQAPKNGADTGGGIVGLLGKFMGGMMGGGGGGGMLSDPRMKVVGGKTHGALDKLDNIDLYKARYAWEPKQADRPMMMAPQVQKVLPNAVTGVPGGPQPQTIKMGDMFPVMIGAMKELHQEVKKIKHRK